MQKLLEIKIFFSFPKRCVTDYLNDPFSTFTLWPDPPKDIFFAL